MRLNRRRLLEAIESGVRYALELDDEDYNNEEQVDFNKNKITIKDMRKPFILRCLNDKRFFPEMKDLLSQYDAIWKPEDKDDLHDMIKAYCEYYNNWTLDLNFIDVSDITDMSFLFADMPEFNGDISKWDVSNVIKMQGMFQGIIDESDDYINDVSNYEVKFSQFNKFNGDISQWDVSNVKDMHNMFMGSEFSGDLRKWKINADSTQNMFAYSLSQNIMLNPANIKLYAIIINTPYSLVYYRTRFFVDIKSMFTGWENIPNWVKNIEEKFKQLDDE